MDRHSADSDTISDAESGDADTVTDRVRYTNGYANCNAVRYTVRYADTNSIGYADADPFRHPNSGPHSDADSVVRLQRKATWQSRVMHLPGTNVHRSSRQMRRTDRYTFADPISVR